MPGGSSNPASEAQLAPARLNVPGARFEQADMTAASFPDATFDAVTAGRHA